jgi:ribosomal protein S6--L-glutamate ligase
MRSNHSRLSLGKRLRCCSSFSCLGVLPNWDDYELLEKQAILNSEEISYPTALYEDIFRSLGKSIFPRNYYRFVGNKIRQTELFQFLGIPHPRTRLYYGRNRAERISSDFEYPFIAKTPVGSSKGCGVYLIENDEDLNVYLDRHLPAYIQEYFPVGQDLRVVLIAGHVIHAYWRIHRPGNFRNNVSQGADISYDNIPKEALDFAVDVAVRCRFDEAGLDICHFEGQFYVIEANMVFGLEGFRRAGLDLCEILARLDREGSL